MYYSMFNFCGIPWTTKPLIQRIEQCAILRDPAVMNHDAVDHIKILKIEYYVNFIAKL
jgi:hypothetical protein